MLSTAPPLALQTMPLNFIFIHLLHSISYAIYFTLSYHLLSRNLAFSLPPLSNCTFYLAIIPFKRFLVLHYSISGPNLNLIHEYQYISHSFLWHIYPISTFMIPFVHKAF